jgi:peptidoglycan hydrolase-like protein with peptidoglycan-binding domain
MAETPLAACADDVCRPLESGNGYSSGNITITAPVGIKGVNRIADVRTIQKALNDVPINQGRAMPPLVMDGICGNKTKDAIQKFQVKHFGWKFADGRVDPLKRTIAKLNQLIPGSGYTIGTGSKENRLPRVLAMLNESLSAVRAARTNLISAASVVNTPDVASPISVFSRSVLMKKVNDHFSVDEHPAAQRGSVVQQLLKIYDRMLQVFARTGGIWGPAIFEIDPLNKPLDLAYTFGGGFFRGGETTIIKDVLLRVDSIYLCDLLDRQQNDRFVLTIIHELAHFCGGVTGSAEHITDHAYGWYDFPKMKHLTVRQRLFNASSYANFAFDAKYSRMPPRANF